MITKGVLYSFLFVKSGWISVRGYVPGVSIG